MEGLMKLASTCDERGSSGIWGCRDGGISGLGVAVLVFLYFSIGVPTAATLCLSHYCTLDVWRTDSLSFKFQVP